MVSARRAASLREIVARRDLDVPVGDDALHSVKQLISHKVASMQADLAADTKESDFCKEQLDDVRARVKKQSKVVKAKLHDLEVAKQEAKGTRDADLKAAHDQKVDAELALDRAKRGATPQDTAALMGTTQAVHRKPPADEDDDEDEIASAKYELKQEMKKLENANQEHEILHQRCITNAGQEQSYEMRTAAREEEIDSLNVAYDKLDDLHK